MTNLLEKIVKHKVLLLVVLGVAIVFFSIGYVTGQNVELNTQVIAEEKESLLSLNTEYQELEAEYDNLSSKLNDAKNSIAKAKKFENQKESLSEEIEQNEQTVSELEGTISNLEAQIAEKNGTLETLNGQIIQAKGNPISLTAGEYTVGGDIPAGRYQASGTSNLFVYNSSGKNKVNQILTKGDYVMTLETGDSLECRAAITLTPVE